MVNSFICLWVFIILIFFYDKYNSIERGVNFMYGFGGYPGYGCGCDGFGGSWIWIIIVVLIIFFVLFCNNGNNRNICC